MVLRVRGISELIDLYGLGLFISIGLYKGFRGCTRVFVGFGKGLYTGSVEAAELL